MPFIDPLDPAVREAKEQYWDSQKGNGSARPSSCFTLTRIIDVVFDTAPTCIVEGLVPREGLILVWGPPKCGKTFWCYDLVAHVARGRPYGERDVEAGPVVYIAAEGEGGIKTRTIAFREERLERGEDPPFFLMTTALDLVEQIDELILAIRAELQLAGEESCKIVVIDTLNRTINGSETRDEDMSRYVAAADRMRESFHCAVIIIHHCGVAGDRPRGHTSLTGAVDAQIAVQKDADGTILATLELMKDGPEGGMIRCRLVPVEIGIDDRGKPVTSCVVEHLGEARQEPRERKKPERRLSGPQARALAMLHEAISTGGKTPPASNHIPANTLAVTEDLWRQYSYKGGISTGESVQARWKAFNKAADTLIGDGKVGAWDGWVWPI